VSWEKELRGLLLGVVLLVCSALAGCGGEENDPDPGGQTASSSSPAELEAGPGTFAYEGDGVTVTLDVPVPADDPRVAELEAYRQQVGADPLFYITVEVDNSADSEDVWTNMATVVTDDKRQVDVAAFSEVNGGVERPTTGQAGTPTNGCAWQTNTAESW
jgi:hypothetical protein